MMITAFKTTYQPITRPQVQFEGARFAEDGEEPVPQIGEIEDTVHGRRLIVDGKDAIDLGREWAKEDVAGLRFQPSFPSVLGAIALATSKEVDGLTLLRQRLFAEALEHERANKK